MRAGVYARVSKQEQAELGYSLDAQLRAMREHAQAQGWVIVKEYVDAGASAASTNRPQFKVLIADAKAGTFDVLLVHKLDRFSRRVVDTLTHLRRLKEWGVSFVSVSEQSFDFTTPIGKAALAILATFAEFYLDNLSQEIRKGLSERARKGLHLSSLPFGYRKGSEGIAEIYEPEAKHVRDIFEWYSSGRYASEDIAVRLNQGGVRTRLGNPWSDRTVMIVVNNVFYLGKVRHRDHVYPGQHPAIISQELFDACQEIRQKRIRRPRSESTKLRVYPLSGILRCHLCKNRLHALSIVDKLYYRCRARRLGAECPGSGKSVRADFMEEKMGRILKGLKPPEGWRARILDLLKVEEDDVESWRAERARLEEKLRRIRQMYKEVEITEEEYRGELAETKERLANLTPPQEMRADELLRAGEYLETLGPAWEAATPRERKEIYQLVLETVYVDVLEKKLVEVVPKAAFLPLFRRDDIVSSTETRGGQHLELPPKEALVHKGD